MATTKQRRHLDMQHNELQNVKGHNLNATPQDVVESQFWYDTVNHNFKYHNGTAVTEFGRVYAEGNGIDITNDTISIDNTVTGATKCKVTYNNNGLVTSGADLSTSDIPDLSATYVNTNLLGANSGVATLGADGKVPSSQLPAYVDDVVELLDLTPIAPGGCSTGDKYYNSTSKKIFTATATNTWSETGTEPLTDVIYVDTSDNKSWRWSGSDMINISNPVAQATESQAGIAAIATSSVVSTGTNDTTIVTPLKLANALYNEATATRTLTNKTISAQLNSISRITASNFETGLMRDYIRDESSASLELIASEKSVASAIKNFITGISSSDVTTALGYTPCKKLTASNGALTASGGEVTWTISNTLGTKNVGIHVYETSTGEEIGCSKVATDSTITIKMNSSADVSADTYFAVIIG